MDPDVHKLNLTLCIDGCGIYYGTFSQWQNFVSALSQGRAENYRHSVRLGEESLTAMLRYLRRTFAPSTAIPDPEQFGLRSNPVSPLDRYLAEQLLAA